MKKEAAREEDVSSVKNTNKRMFLSSAIAKICQICGARYERMVSHFKKSHPNNEVFVSRISPKMANMAKQSKLTAVKYSKMKGQYLRMRCLFCEKECDFPVNYWVDHVRYHTGEYTNECALCDKMSLSYSHCGMPTIKHQKCNIHKDGLGAFLCMVCNYVQISEDAIESHLRTQHGFTELTNRYQTITIVPPLNGLCLQQDPSYVFVGGNTNLSSECSLYSKTCFLFSWR